MTVTTFPIFEVLETGKVVTVTLFSVQKLEALADRLIEERRMSEMKDSDTSDLPQELLKEGDTDGRDIRALIRDMTIPQKMKLAMFGNATCRGLLAFDANRMIQDAVLKNPQLRQAEVEDFAKNPNCPEHVIRTIASSRDWTKSYQMKINLVFNPKTPQDISLKWLSYLRTSDIRNIAKSKNLPHTLATAARKRVAQMQKR